MESKPLLDLGLDLDDNGNGRDHQKVEKFTRVEVASTFSTIFGMILVSILPIYLFKMFCMRSEVRKSSGKELCTCSCFDTIFKGEYENGLPLYKHIYFNVTRNMFLIWCFTFSAVVFTYKIFKKTLFYLVISISSISRLATFCIDNQNQLVMDKYMAIVAITSIFPSFFSWWTWINYLNTLSSSKVSVSEVSVHNGNGAFLDVTFLYFQTTYVVTAIYAATNLLTCKSKQNFEGYTKLELNFLTEKLNWKFCWSCCHLIILLPFFRLGVHLYFCWYYYSIYAVYKGPGLIFGELYNYTNSASYFVNEKLRDFVLCLFDFIQMFIACKFMIFATRNGIPMFKKIFPFILCYTLIIISSILI